MKGVGHARAHPGGHPGQCYRMPHNIRNTILYGCRDGDMKGFQDKPFHEVKGVGHALAHHWATSW